MLRQGMLLILASVGLSSAGFSEARFGLDLSATAQYRTDSPAAILAATPSLDINYQGKYSKVNSQGFIQAQSTNFEAIESPTWQFNGQVDQQLIAPLVSVNAGYQHFDVITNDSKPSQDSYHVGLRYHKKSNLINSFEIETRFQQSYSDLPTGLVKNEAAIASIQYLKQLKQMKQFIALVQYQDYLNNMNALSANLSLIAPLKRGMLTSLIGFSQANSEATKSDVWLGSLSLQQRIPDRATLNYSVSHQRSDGASLLNNIPGFDAFTANQLFDTTNAAISIAFPSLNTRLQTNISYQYSWLESVFTVLGDDVKNKQEYDLANIKLNYSFSEQTQFAIDANYSFTNEQLSSRTNIEFKRLLNRSFTFTSGMATTNNKDWLDRIYATLSYKVGSLL